MAGILMTTTRGITMNKRYVVCVEVVGWKNLTLFKVYEVVPIHKKVEQMGLIKIVDDTGRPNTFTRGSFKTVEIPEGLPELCTA